jgi:hypothetical protein
VPVSNTGALASELPAAPTEGLSSACDTVDNASIATVTNIAIPGNIFFINFSLPACFLTPIKQP